MGHRTHPLSGRLSRFADYGILAICARTSRCPSLRGRDAHESAEATDESLSNLPNIWRRSGIRSRDASATTRTT
jgi:hypothetical protein